jgi:hypothetical protein
MEVLHASCVSMQDDTLVLCYLSSSIRPGKMYLRPEHRIRKGSKITHPFLDDLSVALMGFTCAKTTEAISCSGIPIDPCQSFLNVWGQSCRPPQ